MSASPEGFLVNSVVRPIMRLVPCQYVLNGITRCWVNIQLPSLLTYSVKWHSHAVRMPLLLDNDLLL